MNEKPLPTLPSIHMSDDELQDCFEKCALGDSEAREKIILAFLPLVLKYCNIYKRSDCHVPYEDLFQEGCYGLIVAIDKFDCTRGISFASYALHYVKNYIKAALIRQDLTRPIVYKIDFFYDLQKYLNIFDQQTMELNRYPSDSELAAALQITESRIKGLRNCMYSFISMHSVGDGDASVKLDYEGSCSTEDIVMDRVMDLSVFNVVLTKREEEVLSRRLGFTESGCPESIWEISADLGLSHETIRKAYLEALHKIREAAEANGITIESAKL